jgi:hypothetical protein
VVEVVLVLVVEEVVVVKVVELVVVEEVVVVSTFSHERWAVRK